MLVQYAQPHCGCLSFPFLSIPSIGGVFSDSFNCIRVLVLCILELLRIGDNKPCRDTCRRNPPWTTKPSETDRAVIDKIRKSLVRVKKDDGLFILIENIVIFSMVFSSLGRKRTSATLEGYWDLRTVLRARAEEEGKKTNHPTQTADQTVTRFVVICESRSEFE